MVLAFLPAAGLVTLLAGMGAGTLTVALACAAAWIFVLPPASSFAAGGTGNAYGLAAFGMVALLDVAIIGTLRGALIRARTLTATAPAPAGSSAPGLAGQRQAMLESDLRRAAESRKWADAFHNAAFAVAIVDGPQQSLQLANPAFAAMHGLAVDALDGLPIIDLCAPEDQILLPDLLAAADRTGHASIEVSHVRKGGSQFPVHVDMTSVRGPDGTPLYRIMTVRDLTGWRQAEAMATTMDERFRQIFDESPIGMVMLSGDQRRYLRANTAFCQMLGYGADELLGRSHDTFSHPEDRARGLSRGARAANRRPVEQRFIARSGRAVETQVRMVNLGKDEAGEDLLLGLVEDVTNQRRLEAALQQAQRMEAIGSLAGGMAHDFNNLLGVVIGNLDLLGGFLATQPAAQELVEDALAAALRGADLTRNLLAFARRQPLQPVALDVNEVVDGVRRLLQRVLHPDVAVELVQSDALWPILADRSQLRIVPDQPGEQCQGRNATRRRTADHHDQPACRGRRSRAARQCRAGRLRADRGGRYRGRYDA